VQGVKNGAVRLQSTIEFHDLMVTCTLGAVSALTFWFIWRVGRD
jgi:hypothetical protein